jgi:hypothetical protein
MTVRSQHPQADRPRKNAVVLVAVLASVAVNALALAGFAYVLYGRGLDAAGDRTCDQFVSSDYNQVTEVADRVAIASMVNRAAAKSDSGRIAESARALVPAATGTIVEWRTAARAMDLACADAGWVPDE